MSYSETDKPEGTAPKRTSKLCMLSPTLTSAIETFFMSKVVSQPITLVEGNRTTIIHKHDFFHTAREKIIRKKSRQGNSAHKVLGQ